MANLIIFLFGCLAAALCGIFLIVTVREMRKLGEEADGRTRNEEQRLT
jgi:hypothetical protein